MGKFFLTYYGRILCVLAEICASLMWDYLNDSSFLIIVVVHIVFSKISRAYFLIKIVLNSLSSILFIFVSSSSVPSTFAKTCLLIVQ
jgi:hypothetical protein